MTAAFFKMSFSWWSRVTSRRRLRTAFPGVEEVGADAEFGGEFDNGPADGEEFHGLGFELGSVEFSWFARIHGWMLKTVGPRI
jgi:hypothetical protein